MLCAQDDAKQGLVEFLEENSIDLVITASATTSRFRKTLNVRCALPGHCVRTLVPCGHHVLLGLSQPVMRSSGVPVHVPCLVLSVMRTAVRQSLTTLYPPAATHDTVAVG